ncbi:three-helix bundle dimerization domain-containing protein [Micromonospora chersina]|uniref:three-helix bundle dimerization domain-containing protein n=1 Tax=Micromonospora chersina TaxID=47854 RepID=UPI003CB9C47E
MTDITAHPHQEITLDQQVALHTAATRLAEEFDGIYGAETIERFLQTSYDQFATAASIANYLPLLAERFARQRLRALARVEGHHRDGRPVVLFLCTHNAWSRWAAARRAPSSPAPATRTGPSTTPPGSTWPTCGRSATRSSAASVACSTS